MTDITPTQVYIQIQGGDTVFAITRRILPNQQDAAAYLTEFGVTEENCPTTRRTFTFNDLSLTLSHTLEEIFSDDQLKHSQLVEDMLPTIKASKHMTPTTHTATPVKAPSKTRADLHKAYADAHTPAPNTDTSGVKGPQATFKGDVVPLKEICQILKMEPRTARSKLRKAITDNGKQRWEWPAAEAQKIMGILSSK